MKSLYTKIIKNEQTYYPWDCIPPIAILQLINLHQFLTSGSSITGMIKDPLHLGKIQHEIQKAVLCSCRSWCSELNLVQILDQVFIGYISLIR